MSTIFAVVSIHTHDDELEREFLVNYSHHDTKVWLTKTTVWCLTNDRSLSLEAASPEDLKTMKMFIPSKEG